MGATLATINDTLQRNYKGKDIVDQMRQSNEFVDKLLSQTKYKAGEELRVVIHTSRNGGWVALPDGGGNTNAAGNQGYNKAVYNYKHFHQTIAIQEDALEGSQNDSVALANVLDSEVSGASNDMRRQLTRMLFGDGSGNVCACGVTTASATVVLGTDGFNAIERGFLDVGFPVNIGTAGSEASLVSGETISAVSEVEATPTITVTTPITTTSANFVSWKGSRSGSTSYETNGLRNIASATATVGGLSVTTQPKWQAAVANTTAQALTLSLMLQRRQKIVQKTGETNDAVLTGLKQERKFYELLQQQVTYNSDSAIDAGNSDKATWSGQRIWVHPDCPNEDMFFFTMKHLFPLASDMPFWQNKYTGGKILEHVQGTAAYGGKLGFHYNIGTDRRNAFAYQGGLT